LPYHSVRNNDYTISVCLLGETLENRIEEERERKSEQEVTKACGK